MEEAQGPPSTRLIDLALCASAAGPVDPPVVLAFASELGVGEGRVFAILGNAEPLAESAAVGRSSRPGAPVPMLVAIDAGPAEGRIEWLAPPPAGYGHFASTPVPHADRVLVAIGRGGGRADPALACLHAVDGRVDWTVDLPLASDRPPAVDRSFTETAAGGLPHWTGDHAPERPSFARATDCRVAVTRGRVIVAARSGLAALGLDGRMLWARAWAGDGDAGPATVDPAPLAADRPIRPLLAIADDRIVTASPEGVTCLSLADGRTLWNGPPSASADGGPIDAVAIDPARGQALVSGEGLFACRLADGMVTRRFGRGRYRSIGGGVVIGDVFYWPAQDHDAGGSVGGRDAPATILTIPAATLEPASPFVPSHPPAALASVGGMLIHCHESVVDALLPIPPEASP